MMISIQDKLQRDRQEVKKNLFHFKLCQSFRLYVLQHADDVIHADQNKQTTASHVDT